VGRVSLMKEIQVYEVLRKPLITEKNTMLQSQGKYAFEVASGANKSQVKQAVEKAFKVTVTGVNVITVKGKTRRAGRRVMTTSPSKKAIVSLKPGDKIELFEGV
jgi:large subunit ribosomal protein L23